MKSGISAVGAVLVTFVVLIIAAIIFLSFMRGGFIQEQELFEKAHEATGQIPCMRAPIVKIEPAFLIDLNKNEINDLFEKGRIIKKVDVSVNISSTCFEDLTVVLKSGSTTTESLCIYKRGKYVNNNTEKEENCTFFEVPVTITKEDILNYLNLENSIGVFGRSSGYYAESSFDFFVKDPYLNITITEFNFDDFPCVNFKFNFTTILPKENFNEYLPDIFVEEKGRLREVIHNLTAYGCKSGRPLKCVATGSYRSEAFEGQHNLKLAAKVKLQEVKNYHQFETHSPLPSNFSFPEIFVFGQNGILEVFAVNSTNISETFYKSYHAFSASINGKTPRDVAADDLDGDGITEVVLLYDKALLVYKLTESDEELLTELIDKNQLNSNTWPFFYTPSEDRNYVEVQIGNNINCNNSYLRKAIVALSSLQGDIEVFAYTPNGLNRICWFDIDDYNYEDFAIKDNKAYYVEKVEKEADESHANTTVLDLSTGEKTSKRLVSGFPWGGITVGNFMLNLNPNLCSNVKGETAESMFFLENDMPKGAYLDFDKCWTFDSVGAKYELESARFNKSNTYDAVFYNYTNKDIGIFLPERSGWLFAQTFSYGPEIAGISVYDALCYPLEKW
ncbi:MAG: hypothetical protein QXQ79_00425 [Candidatus Nanoarchaeia archaeon]